MINDLRNLSSWGLFFYPQILTWLKILLSDFSECQLCTNCFIFLLTLANVNSVQTVLYFFWLWRMSILYTLFYISFDFGECQFCANCFIFLSFNVIQIIPCHIFWLCAVVFLLFLIHLRQFFVYTFIKSNTPLTSVKMNLNHSATQAPRPWW